MSTYEETIALIDQIELLLGLPEESVYFERDKGRNHWIHVRADHMERLLKLASSNDEQAAVNRERGRIIRYLLDRGEESAAFLVAASWGGVVS